jgi:hypothetical protein
MRKAAIIMMSAALLCCWSTVFSQAAVTFPVNLKGTWEGTARIASGTEFITTPLTIKITSQSGPLFLGNVTFPPPFGDNIPSSFNGALFDGQFRITDGANTIVGGRLNLFNPNGPLLEGYFHNRENNNHPEQTGVFTLKKTSNTF